MSMDITPGKPLRVYDSKGFWRDYSTDEFVGQKLNYLKGWSCGAGVQNLAIQPSGRVSKAACMTTQPFGNIFEEIEFPNSWVVCALNECTCGADLFIPKAKNPEARELLRATSGKSTQILKRRSELVERVALERTHASNRKQVYWELTHLCNYSCSYCSPAVHNKTDKPRPFADLLKATAKLHEQFAQGQPLNFIISGGEPTTHPQLLDWVRLLATLGHHVSLHSNGWRKPDYYRELIRYCDLNLSLHFESFKSEHFFEVVRALAFEKAKRKDLKLGHVEVKIMMAPGDLNRCAEVEARLSSLPGFRDHCICCVVPIRVGDHLEEVSPKYSSQEQELFGVRPLEVD